MIQLRLDGTRRSRRPDVRSSWRTGAAMVRLTLGMTARPLRHLLQSDAGDRAHRPSAAQPLPRAAALRSTFERWFARYQLPLLDYLYGMTRDREWAADLVQETFLQAYSAAGRDPTAIEHPQAWLYRIATNTALSALRRKRRFSWLPLSVVEPEAGASSSDRWLRPDLPDLAGQDIAASVAERDAVWRVLAELPPRWRAVLLLQTTGGFEVREIASELSISEANTRKLLFRAKERFRQVYAQLEEAEAKGDIR
ncbi:MAG TPA: sigma-70 family RNA polymerase sigma factor [Ktedonobacterales bacterium]|nr:sigma-70 family RNA polymerase sigma factor [Ktedonobacterales bacterium]